MKNLNSLYIVILCLFLGCGSTSSLKKETINSNLKVVDIEEYQYAYRFRVLEDKSKDTILIVSFKDNFYNKNNLKKPKGEDSKQIVTDNNYNFKLLLIKSQVSTMQQLGAFIIVEKDTLWKERSYKTMPKSYTAQNTIGLSIYE